LTNRSFRVEWSIQSGKFKYDLIRSARERVDRAIKLGFHIEAIALLESLIADRLESCIEYKSGETQRVQNLGPLVKSAISYEIISVEFAAEIRKWSDNRARVIHEMVKVSSEISGNLKERMKFARELALEGKEMLKRIEKISRSYRPIR
jgi:hypothetical protein